MTIFGLISLHNVRNMHKKNVQKMRLDLEKQLTSMVLMKILSVTITVPPFLTAYLIRYILSAHTNNTVFQNQILLVYRVFIILFYVNYAVSLNCVS